MLEYLLMAVRSAVEIDDATKSEDEGWALKMERSVVIADIM
jgi:hypothetical protein